MAQADIRRPLTAEARFRSRVGPCGICGWQSGTETGFSPSISVFLCQFHSIDAPLKWRSRKNLIIFLILVGLHNKPSRLNWESKVLLNVTLSSLENDVESSKKLHDCQRTRDYDSGITIWLAAFDVSKVKYAGYKSVLSVLYCRNVLLFLRKGNIYETCIT